KDQSLKGGGVKLYRGGPDGLDSSPLWLSRGYAATGIALADITGDGALDILVSRLSEEGTIQAPHTNSAGHFEGRARLLINQPGRDSSTSEFQEHVIERDEARGAGDVTVADVDLDGTLDVVFAGRRTAVLYGDPQLNRGRAWEHAPVWTSEEEHPFSFTAQAFSHPAFAGSLLVASSRGLLSAEQLAGRSLGDVQTGVFIHRPERKARTSALQHLALLDEKRPEIPAGITIAHDSEGYPCLIAGFLDARGRDIRGAALRMFNSGDLHPHEPFDDTQGTALPGGGLMAGRVIATPRAEGPNSVSDCCIKV